MPLSGLRLEFSIYSIISGSYASGLHCSIVEYTLANCGFQNVTKRYPSFIF